jgi:CNT family concentrative nucleoside transporter
MTNSELFVLMASGMAHISGGMMVVYISYGANPVAVLTTCVMACPCSLYLSKLFLPEVSKPETGGTVQTKKEKSPYVNAIDAAATGTTDGLQLALNVGAMLIVFIAFVALFDAVLGGIGPALVNWHIIRLDILSGGIFDGCRRGRREQSGQLARIEAIDQRTLRVFANAANAAQNRSDDRRFHARRNQ